MTTPKASNQIESENAMKFKSFVVGIAVLIALHLAAHTQTAQAAGQDSKGSTIDVKIDNFSFSPATITIPAGSTVKWTNRDDIPHTVVNDDQKFDSKTLDTDESYSYTFTKPGTYPYFCSIHPKMTGKVIVQ
jgi:plastocyanin